MVRRLVLIAALLTCVTAYAIENIVWIDFTQPIELSGGVWRNVPAGGSTNWYDVYPDYQYTKLVARFTSTDPLTNEAFSVTGGLVDPGGAAAPAFTSNIVDFGGNDYVDCGDSWTNYGGQTNYAVAFWVNRDTDVANGKCMSNLKLNQQADGEYQIGDNVFNAQDMYYQMDISAQNIGVTNVALDHWDHFVYVRNGNDATGKYSTVYFNGTLYGSSAYSADGGPFGKAGSPLYIGARPFPGSLLGLDGAMDDVIVYIYGTETNYFTAGKVTNLYNLGRSSN